MERARRHQRLLSVLAFGLLALAANLAGRELVSWVDLGRHVPSPSYSGAAFYPLLLVGVKAGIALMLARLAWRAARARARLRGAGATARPRLRIRLSPRLWLAFFAVTSLIYLVQAHGEHAGRWPLLAPWLHTSALPMFAVVSVVCAVVWRAVQRWLAEYEECAERAELAAVRARRPDRVFRPRPGVFAVPPRRLFGLVFECRPPPLAA